jgi:hypothetical protein
MALKWLMPWVVAERQCTKPPRNEPDRRTQKNSTRQSPIGPHSPANPRNEKTLAVRVVVARHGFPGYTTRG